MDGLVGLRLLLIVKENTFEWNSNYYIVCKYYLLTNYFKLKCSSLIIKLSFFFKKKTDHSSIKIC